jgi:heptosyltransferase-2
MAPTVAKTLIIRFSSVGDIILSSLLIRTFRKRFPEAQIDFLVKAEYAELLRGNPHLTRILEFPAGGTFTDLKHLRRKVRAANYDLIVDIHGNLRSRYVALGASMVARYRKRTLARRALVHLKWNLYAPHHEPPSVALRYLAPVRRFDVIDDALGLEVFLDTHDRAVASSLLREAGLETVRPLVGIAPSARHRTKIWPPERYARAAALFLQHRPGAVVLLGAEHDRPVCQSVLEELSRIAPRIPVANLAGTMSLTQTAAVVDDCAVVLANDSGLMHLAAARKRPLVALFGPTVREFGFFPLGTRSIVLEQQGLPCRPCSTIGGPRCPRTHFRCMLDTAPEEVAASAEQVLSA